MKLKLIILLVLFPIMLWVCGCEPPEDETVDSSVELVMAPLCLQSARPSHTLSDSDLVELATRYRMISDAKTGFTVEQMARLREIRPNIQIVRYLNFSAVSDPLRAELILRNYPDWVMRDAAGDSLPARLSQTGVMLRPNSEGWRSYLVQKASRFVTLRGYDGIMADCVMMCAQLGSDFTGINTETGQPYTIEEFRQHQLGLVRAVKAAIGGNQLILNNVRRGIHYFEEQPDSFLNAADGVVAEGFRGYSRSLFEHYPSDEAWLANVRMMVDVQKRGKAIIAVVKIDKKVAERYEAWEVRRHELLQYCTFLLGMGDSAYYAASITDPDPHMKTLLFERHHKIDLGEPINEFRETADGIYRRGFKWASVIVDLNEHTGMILQKVPIEDAEIGR